MFDELLFTITFQPNESVHRDNSTGEFYFFSTEAVDTPVPDRKSNSPVHLCATCVSDGNYNEPTYLRYVLFSCTQNKFIA